MTGKEGEGVDRKTALVVSEKAEERREEKASYWARVGGAYRFVFRALFLLLPIFVIAFMALCAGGFTRNSVFGFGRDLRSISSFLSSDYKDVSYTYREGARVVLSYHDGVATVTSGGIEIYSPDGKRLLNVEMTFRDPRAVCSQKYLLVYDFGGKSFTVTGAYGMLFSGETDFPIYGADVADTGHFALVTGSDTHLSQLLLYDANFKLIQRFQRDSVTTAVALADNGKYVAIGGMTATDGVVQGVVETYRVGVKNSAFRVTLDEPVLRVDFTDNRHIAVLGAGSLRVMDTDGDWNGVIAFGGATLNAYDANENGCALVLGADPLHRESRVVICDKKGETLFDEMQEGDASDVSLTKENAFLLCGTRAVRLAWKTGERNEIACPEAAEGIFAVNGSALRMIYAGVARYVEFD